MDHILKALDAHIAHLDWMIKCANRENENLKTENDRLKAMLASTPATLSRAEFEEIHNAPDCIVQAGDVGHDT
ncbi:MAG TPA: hypothetical protein P5244_02625 [Syntrophales bacterium]|nr:hypothetical protein [Syntrophales bacterium]